MRKFILHNYIINHQSSGRNYVVKCSHKINKPISYYGAASN